METPPIIKGKVETPVVKTKETALSERGLSEIKSTAKNELYATYELDHNAPYIAEMFGIDKVWNEPGLAYKKEVQAIDAHLKIEIQNKELENTTNAVREYVEQMERLAGVSKTAPVEIKMKALASFAAHMSRLNSIQRGKSW